MFGLGMGEIFLIGVVGVMLFGGKKLPELGSSLGKAITNFKKGLAESSGESGEEGQETDQKKSENKKLPS